MLVSKKVIPRDYVLVRLNIREIIIGVGVVAVTFLYVLLILGQLSSR